MSCLRDGRVIHCYSISVTAMSCLSVRVFLCFVTCATNAVILFSGSVLYRGKVCVLIVAGWSSFPCIVSFTRKLSVLNLYMWQFPHGFVFPFPALL